MWKLASIWLQNHWFLVQFSGLSVALILIHTFILLFFFFFSHVSLCFAWYLAWHTQLPISPNTIITLPHPSSSCHCTSSPPIIVAPDSWADSGVRSTRSMGGAAHTPSKLILSDLPPGGGQARGISAGIHPHLINRQPNHCGVRSVSWDKIQNTSG